MKKLAAILTCLMVLAVLVGCGQQEEPQPGDTGAAGHADEVADSTRMDSAAGLDTAAEMPEDTAATEEPAGQ